MRVAHGTLGLLFGISTLVFVGCGTNANNQHGAHTTGGTGGAGGAGGFGSGGSDVGGSEIGGLAPLPPPRTVDTDLFSTADRCAFCHTTDGTALVDAAGRDVSPYALWRGSMMAFAGRDPYWLAAMSHELADHPTAKDTIEATCTRCHAPAAAVTHAQTGEHVSFDDIITGTTDADVLAREGVGCAVCHQIKPDNLGQPSSFTGNYEIGSDRRIFGPHQNPVTMPMLNNVNFTPTHATHVTDSGLCATCHTVITRSLDESGNPTGPELPEQVPYLEWQNSIFSSGPSEKTCADCHMPVTDEDGNAINTRISNRPPWIDPRSPVGRHVLTGGNAYMLGLLAENAAWTGTDVPQSVLLDSEKRAEASLASAATLTIQSATRSNGELTIDVAVENHTGHKFPTAYPSRRAFIHLSVTDAKGALVFESGRFDERGALVDAAGKRLDDASTLLPHRDVITSDAEVQVYQSVLVDASGAPTHGLLRATGYAKDNRILPAGFSDAHPSIAMTKPIGVTGDASFAPGSDHVTYRVAAPSGPLTVSAELYFQSVPPAEADVLADVKSAAAATFTAMVKARPPVPSKISAATTAVP